MAASATAISAWHLEPVDEVGRSCQLDDVRRSRGAEMSAGRRADGSSDVVTRRHPRAPGPRRRAPRRRRTSDRAPGSAGTTSTGQPASCGGGRRARAAQLPAQRGVDLVGVPDRRRPSRRARAASRPCPTPGAAIARSTTHGTRRRRPATRRLVNVGTTPAPSVGQRRRRLERARSIIGGDMKLRARILLLTGGARPAVPRAMPLRDNDDCELYYETFGSPTDPTLLLVNGLGIQCINYKPTSGASKFVAAGFHVIRFDNRDVGLSTHFADAPRRRAGRGVHVGRHGRRRSRRPRRQRRRPGARDGCVDGRDDRPDSSPSTIATGCCR